MGFTDDYALTSGARRWRAFYRNPEGAQKSKSGFKTKRDAEAFIAKTEVSKLDQTYIAPDKGKVTVGEFGARWMKSHLIKPSGKRSYDSAWRVHVEPRWGRTPLSRVERQDVVDWVAELNEKLGAKSVQRCHGVLHGVLQAAVDNGMIVRNVASKVRLPQPSDDDPVFLTHGQLEALIIEAGNGKRTRADAPAIIAVLGYCGLRWGELAALTPDHFMGNKITVRENAVAVGSTIHRGTPKGGDRRRVPIPNRVLALVAPIVNTTKSRTPVFPDKDGKEMKPPGVNTWFSRAVARCQDNDPTFPDLTAHKLRHTAVSLAIYTGCSIKTVQAVAGHKDATMTLNKYGHLMSEELDELADALDVAAAKVTGIDWASKCSENAAGVVNLNNSRKSTPDNVTAIRPAASGDH
ncbi:site-specific integrase [Mycolicibacterium lutetiense]|uniref:Integrase n=1 Tax=Mycolicibacterium lutetiense TaxID=1641992 RepID=A0ABS4ZSQ8_9MYCO|nr:site-specific integrase [Mycolicibacterium lutetiense]MBP2452519.1 integrase [Mycolicibacterium lutetiense]